MEVDSNLLPSCATATDAYELVAFKPEFSGKPDEDVEVHLLRTNDWMNMHDFPEAVKV